MSKGEAGLLQNQRNEGKSGNSKKNASNLYQIREIRKFFFWMSQAAFPKKIRMADLSILSQ